MVREDENSVIPEAERSRNGSCWIRLFWLALVPLLIFAGAVAAYLGYLPLRMAFHSVVMIGMIFIIYLFFIKHNAWYGACKFRKRQQVLSASLERYIEKNLLDIGGVRKANAPFNQFIRDFTASLRNDNFASVAASVFPTLGILGTFISIALTMPDFASRNSAQLEQEISQLLSGVGTAFYVSIYGIFLSLWWIFFEKKGMSAFEKQVRRIREKTRGYFWTKEEIEQVHFTQSMKNYENLNAIFSKITSNEFLDNIQNALHERLGLFESIIHHEQKALRKSSEHFDEILQLSDRSMQVSEQLFNSYEKIGTKLQEVVQSLEQSQKLMRLVNQELTIKEENIMNATHALANSVKSLQTALQNVSAENIGRLYDDIRASLEAMQAQSAQIAKSFNAHLEAFDENYSNKLRMSLELIDSETAKIIRELSRLGKLER